MQSEHCTVVPSWRPTTERPAQRKVVNPRSRRNGNHRYLSDCLIYNFLCPIRHYACRSRSSNVQTSRRQSSIDETFQTWDLQLAVEHEQEQPPRIGDKSLLEHYCRTLPPEYRNLLVQRILNKMSVETKEETGNRHRPKVDKRSKRRCWRGAKCRNGSCDYWHPKSRLPTDILEVNQCDKTPSDGRVTAHDEFSGNQATCKSTKLMPSAAAPTGSADDVESRQKTSRPTPKHSVETIVTVTTSSSQNPDDEEQRTQESSGNDDSELTATRPHQTTVTAHETTDTCTSKGPDCSCEQYKTMLCWYGFRCMNLPDCPFLHGDYKGMDKLHTTNTQPAQVNVDFSESDSATEHKVQEMEKGSGKRLENTKSNSGTPLKNGCDSKETGVPHDNEVKPKQKKKRVRKKKNKARNNHVSDSSNAVTSELENADAKDHVNNLAEKRDVEKVDEEPRGVTYDGENDSERRIRCQQELRQQKERAKNKTKLKRKNRRDRYLAKIREETKVREAFWEKEIARENEVVRNIRLLVAAELCLPPTHMSSEEAVNTTMSLQSCTLAYRQLYQGETMVVVAGSAQKDLNGKRGRILYWEPNKDGGKFLVQLESKKGRKQQVYMTPGNLEAREKSQTTFINPRGAVGIRVDTFVIDVHKSTIDDMLTTNDVNAFLDHRMTTLMQQKLKSEIKKEKEGKENEVMKRLEAEIFHKKMAVREKKKQLKLECKKIIRRFKASIDPIQREKSPHRKGCRCLRCMRLDREESYLDIVENEDRDEHAVIDDDQLITTDKDIVFMDKQEALMTLGLQADAATSEIRRAYIQKALAYHPDRFDLINQDSGMTRDEVAEKFKNVVISYQYLVSKCD